MADEQEDGSYAPPSQKQKLADEATRRAMILVAQCNKFKQPRLDQIARYRELYAGKVKKKFRQPFNVVLPVFSGAMDTLAADFNDDLAVDITETEPADYLAIRKANALWKQETTSVAPNAKFAYKTRTDRFNALFSGRGFMMNYAVSDPEYRNHFETFELEDAIFQPDGGGQWATHLYAGRQNVRRTAAQLKSGIYDKQQVRKLLARANDNGYVPPDTDANTQAGLAKFKAMGLNTSEASYVGEQVFKLVEMRITMDGVRYYLVFSPYYDCWLRFEPFKDVFAADIDPWVSWATHEDNKNFLNKSYADDIYGIADAVHTLFNQELTNREKQNLNARAFDREMFPDVAKLDQAQTRPDALVPVDTKGGARKIGEGIYEFKTPQLTGTINLIEWMEATTGRNIGVTDLSQGGVQNVSKKATVVFAEQQNISKRLLLRSSSYTEAMGEIAKIFIQGAKEHLPTKMAIKRLGIEGQDWEGVIRRTDLDLYGDIDVKITSSAVEMRNSTLKKQARKEVLDSIAADPAQAAQVNPKFLVEEKLRSVAEFDDAEIAIAMDTKNYGNKEEVAYAHRGIQAILNNEQPDTFYGATTLFMQIIHDYAVNNRTSLGDRKFNALIDYEMAHAAIAEENMLRKADAEAAVMPLPAEEAAPEAPAAPAPASPLSEVRSIARQIA
jgi:hypothetical protein